MPAEPYPSYMPEINSGRAEAGFTGASWAAVGLLWDATFLEVEALGLMSAAQSASIAMTFQGLTAAKLAMTSPPFFSWLQLAGATALMHAQACVAIASAYAELETSIIPLVAVTANRTAELAAEASNVFGQNTPLIVALDAQYAEFWTQDGASMLAYDTEAQAALIPKPLPPPPIISSAADTASAAADAASQAAVNAATSSTMQGMMQAVESNPLTQGGAAAASSPMEAMGSMGGVMGAVTSAPQAMMGAMTSAPQALMGPMQSMVSPAMGMMSQFSKPNMSGLDKLTGFATVPGAFGSVGGPGGTGGLPLSHLGGGGGGGGSLSAPGAYGGGMSAAGVAPLMHQSALRGPLPTTGVAMPAGGPIGPGGGGGGGVPMMPRSGSESKSATERPVIEEVAREEVRIHERPDRQTLRTLLS